MRAIDLNTGWTCRHLEETGKGMPVSIPDDAMLREERRGDAAGGLNVSWFEGRDYLYTRMLTLTTQEARRHNVLEFEGVYRKAEVLVNGQKAAFRPYGYTNFYVPLDGLVHEGENVIEVIARNSDQPNSRWYSGAGIYRPVKWWSSGKDHIELNGVKIRTLSLDPAQIEVTVKTSGEGTVSLDILDGDQTVVSTEGDERVFILTLPDARLWSPEHPHLYTCRMRYAEDEAEGPSRLCSAAIRGQAGHRQAHGARDHGSACHRREAACPGLRLPLL